MRLVEGVRVMGVARAEGEMGVERGVEEVTGVGAQ